jgi:hypothetical protein
VYREETLETTEQAAWDQRYSGADLVWGAGPNRFVAAEVAALPPRAARLAAERRVTVDWVQADLLDYQPAPGNYDLVLIAYLHLPSTGLARVFRTAAAAVAAGGTLLVIGHDRDNITRGHGGPQDPDRLYTPGLVTAQLSGLAIRRVGQVPRPVRTPEGERTAIDTLVRAERPA